MEISQSTLTDFDWDTRGLEYFRDLRFSVVTTTIRVHYLSRSRAGDNENATDGEYALSYR